MRCSRQCLQAGVAAACVAASTLALGTQRLVFLDGTLLEMLQLQGISLAWEHFLIPSVWERMWDEHWEQAKGNKGKEMGSREAAGLWEERREPHSQQWKTWIDQAPAMLGWWCYASACALMES